MARGASTASDKAGKARRAQPEARRGRRGRGKREIGREERRRGGEGLRAAHLARTQLTRQAERIELCDSGSEGKERGKGGGWEERGGNCARRSAGQGAAGTQSDRSDEQGGPGKKSA